MRAIEAWHAKRYWHAFYEKAGVVGGLRRAKTSKLTSCLDAASKFISGILLRWICFHHLSPNHGFSHIPTDYPALVYDLMEPYRGFIDQTVLSAYQSSSPDSKQFMTVVFSEIKTDLDKKVYVNATRQIVTMHELYHGIVLALKSYLMGNRRFIVPTIDIPTGGRPINAGYKLYGKTAGIINTWPEVAAT
jgi:CRISPR/Cas system-associated endonuclease Cas1